jgi:hypothetical protein
MSLENLVKINQLNRHETTPQEIARLLAAAQRNRVDSAAQIISDETRFDAAYKAIMQRAMAGLCASGSRPSNNTPGHHQTLIQSLELTMAVPPEVWRVLDALRRKRNQNDYSGDLIEPASVRECIEQAAAMLEWTKHWLKANRPELLLP